MRQHYLETTTTPPERQLLVRLPDSQVPGGASGGPSSAQVGAVTETAPASDTASSGLNGRLQRIAQRLTSLIALTPMPTAASRILSAAASTNATVAKASAGTYFGVKGYVARASAVYLKIYNKATTPSDADTPALTVYLPPLTAFALDEPRGFVFATGISYRLVTGGADNDTGALTAGDVLALNLLYA